MANNNNDLRNIIAQMSSDWINLHCRHDGLQGFLFGWANEVNDVHKKDLPFMVVQPPTTSTSLSEMQHDLVKQTMNFTLQIYDFVPSDLSGKGYLQQANQWDTLENCFYRWLEMVLFNLGYQVVLGDGSLNMTRTKMAGNDSMFMLECKFNISVFRTCFTHFGN